jgi:hypothetical protein
MQQTAQLAALKNPESAIARMQPVQAGFFNLQSFELMQRIAKGFAASTLVPKEYQNNVGNCMIALNLAQRIGGDPLMVMQNLIVIYGRPSWSSQYLIATANMCGRFSAIRFEFFGKSNTDEWGCRAWAIEHATGEKLFGSDVTIAIAKQEGWYTKNGSKWKSIPQQMLMYRSGAWWVRAYAPELSMGLMTTDEVVDTFDAEKGSDGTYSVNIDDLKQPAVDTETGEISPASQNAEKEVSDGFRNEAPIESGGTVLERPTQQPARQRKQMDLG